MIMFLQDKKIIEFKDYKTLRKILLEDSNSLQINFEKDFFLSGEAFFEVVAKKIAERLFDGNTLKITYVGTVPSQLLDSPFTNEIHTKIQLDDYTYQAQIIDFTSLKDSSKIDALNVFHSSTDINRFRFFNDFLLDLNKEDRIFQIAHKDKPSEVFYTKMSNDGFEKLNNFFLFDRKFEINGGHPLYGFNLDDRYRWQNLNESINGAREVGLQVVRSNEEIIYSLRESNFSISSPENFLYEILRGNQNMAMCRNDFGGVSYDENKKNPFEVILNLLEKSSNGFFKADSFTDNIEEIELKPFTKKRKVKISFIFKEQVYQYSWNEKTIAKEDYSCDDNRIFVLLKDVVSMVNKAFAMSNTPFQFYLLQQYKYFELPNTAVLLSKVQYEWFLKKFPDIFWDGIYPVE